MNGDSDLVMSPIDKLKAIQTLLGVEDDGRFEKLSHAALESLIIQARTPAPAPPQTDAGGAVASSQWPKEADAAVFYGKSDGSSKWESENLVTFDAPYAMFMDGRLVRSIRCHKKVRESLSRILTKIRELYITPDAIRAVGLDQYDGCYNFRPVRGSTSRLSMHSYGAAIDFDSEHNPLGATHGRMPAEVVAIFKAEGWRWGGDYQNRKDWMHFEACR